MLQLTRAQGLALALIVLGIAVFALAGWARWRAARSGGETAVGAWRLGLSQAISACSFWILLGVSAAAYVRGLAALWIAIGILAGALLNWFYVGRRLRSRPARVGTGSLPVWLEATGATDPPSITPAKTWTGTTSTGAAAIVLVILLIALVAQLRVAGLLLAQGLGVATGLAVVLVAVLALLPVLIGGRRAAIDVAALGATLVLPCALLMMWPALAFASAFGNIFETLRSMEPVVTSWTGGSLLTVLGALVVGLTLPGQPHVLDQFPAARSERAVSAAGVLAMAWFGLVLAAMLAFGWSALILYSSIAVPDLVLADATMRLLPPVLQGLPALAVCMAVCASVGHQLLAVTEAAAPHWLARADAAQRPKRLRAILLGAAALITAVAASLDFGSTRVFLFAIVTLGAVIAPALIARLAGAQWRPGTIAVIVRIGLIGALLLFLAGCGVNPVTGKKELQLVGEGTEVRIGQENYLPSRQTQGGDFVIDPQLTAYVSEVGNKLAQVSDRKLPYEFAVLNNSVPNAWALPGGKIAVNRGLLTQLNSEAELAAVLGHEIVHSAARHGARSMERGMLLQAAMLGLQLGVRDNEYAGLIVGSAMLGANLISTRYGREAELESDHYGMGYMKRAGYDPAAAIDLQKTFVKLSEGRRQNWLEGLFASHPPSQERVARNEETAREIGAGGEYGRERYQQKLASLRRLEPAYQQYDRGVEELRKGNPAAALTLAHEAIELEPREAKFHELSGDAELARKNTKAALAHYQQAIERNPNYFKPYLQTGIAQYQGGERGAARASLERSMQLLPTAPASYYLARLAQQAGDVSSAVKYFQMAAGSNSDIGRESNRELVKLDLPRNPGNYFRIEPRLDNQGRVWLLVENRAPVPVRGLTLAAAVLNENGSIAQGPVRVSIGRNVLASGAVAQLATSLGPIADPNLLRRVRYQIDSVALAE